MTCKPLVAQRVSTMRGALPRSKATAARVREESTASKVFYQSADQIILSSVNAKHPPITIHASNIQWAYRVVKSVRDEE